MDAYDHFMDLVSRGKGPGPSIAESHALWLAWSVVENVPGLDSEARDGLCEFIHYAAASPDSARKFLENG